MTEEEIYLQGILASIEETRARGGKGVFRINDKISNTTAFYVRDYFTGNPEYSVEIRKCPSCTHTWDVMIYFGNRMQST